jgi:hypothetical protein
MSGIVSYFGYSHRVLGLVLMSILMIGFPLLTMNWNLFFIIFFVVNAITIIMKMVSFDVDLGLSNLKYKDIHLWESLVTGGYVMYLMLIGHNILLLMCSVYPALILHKGFINLGCKLTFFAEATDDPTGKTYGIPLLGIKVKRSSTKFRLIAAGVSLLIALIVLVLHFDISVGWFAENPYIFHIGR